MKKRNDIWTMIGLKVQKLHFGAAIAIITVGLCACEYKDLEEGMELNTVIIDFDMEARVDSAARAMRVAFYPVDEMARSNMEKGYTFFDLPMRIWPAKVQVPSGVYDIVAWNIDTEHVITDKYGNKQTLHATTPPYNSKGTFDMPAILDSIYGGQQVLDYPDYMVHANRGDMEIDYDHNHKITLVPDSMVVNIEMEIHGIGGLSWVKEARGTVNNVAGKRYIAYQDLTEEAVTVMFDCRVSEKDSIVYADFYVFGIEPSDKENLTHKMVLFFWMDGGKVFIPIDVTKVFAEYRKEQKKIVIEVPSLGIDLRDYMTTQSTFDVNVDSWDDVNVDIGF